MSYITASEYTELTGRDEGEATAARIQSASMLLDARIGNYTRNDDGWKLDITGLKAHEERAVKLWTSQMVAYLYENDDILLPASSLSLGRFSVSESTGESQGSLPKKLQLADNILVSSGLIQRSVNTK